MIKGFNKELFLKANKNKYFEKNYFNKKIWEDIKIGKVKFHPEYEPFNEDIYIRMNEDIQRAIQNKQLKSGWEHFINFGYEELIKNDLYRYYKIAEKIYCAIDYIFLVDKKHLFISGWRYSLESDNIDIYIDNKKVDIINFERPDLKNIENIEDKYKKAGFIGIFELKEDIIRGNIEIDFISEKNNIKTIKKDLQFFKPKEKSKIILDYLDLNSDEFVKWFDLIGEPLKSMWNEYYSNLKLDIKIKEYGEVSKKAKLSIIVPLYGRIDFIEFQNAIFSIDEDFLEYAELIYVLDDPERFENIIHRTSEQVYNIYNVPFKMITYNYNLGYARANNIGVKYATSDMILLFNSDVFPKQKGWVSKLLDKYNKLQNPGALGFKLLYEDESIQHVGMEFRKYKAFNNMWINYHLHKGMPDMNKIDEMREVPAVTGACMLLEKKKYEQVGGLSEEYVLGDFEDSDLCLKLKEKGYKIYYSSTPEFYHLERQSQSLFDDNVWKYKITVFNCWQHMKKWDYLLQKVSQ